MKRIKKRLSSAARKRRSGQAMTEYIIIVVVVALAALTIFAIFSDTIQDKLAGATLELDPDADVPTVDSLQYLQDLEGDN